MENIGVFICTGCEIGKSLNIDELESSAKENGIKTVVKDECLCAPDGILKIQKSIDDDGIDGVIVAACSHRMKQSEFTFDKTKVAVDRVCLREQVVWTHKADEENKEDTQMLANDLLSMGIAKTKVIQIAKPLEEDINSTVLIVGGGLTGMTAALSCTGLGNDVVLVEKEAELGGYLKDVKYLVPEHPPYERIVENNISNVISSVDKDSKIKVFTSTKIKKISGQPGQFEVEIITSGGDETFKAGSIIQATGATAYDASKLSHLGFGKSKNIVTTSDVEAMISNGKVTVPSTGNAPERIVFVQCAGSRDENHLKYCSGECCSTTLKLISAIKIQSPDTECAVIYKDMRTPGQLEHFYEAVQEKDGAILTRGDVSKVEVKSDSLKVYVKNSLLGEDIAIDSDLVVLATGMVPNSADGEAIRELKDAYGRIEKNESKTQVEEAEKLVEKLKRHEGTEILNLDYRQGPDFPLLSYDYPDSHYICFPYETRRTGIYAAGALHAPMDVAQATEDAFGAAMKAHQSIESEKRGEAVHPRSGDVGVADFFMQRCTQCKRCTEECPFGAINEDEKGTPEYNPLRCRRCGICLGACPEKIVTFPDYSIESVSSMIKSVEVPDEDDEKPRMLAFMCENDAVPALDEAAARKLELSQWIRVIPVRCLGAITTVWIADALSAGIDGILMIGCKRGDDYQCHYMQGSELANTRMGNLQETLDRLALESDRVQVHEVERDEFEKIPKIFADFEETIEEIGPNPFKGF